MSNFVQSIIMSVIAHVCKFFFSRTAFLKTFHFVPSPFSMGLDFFCTYLFIYIIFLIFFLFRTSTGEAAITSMACSILYFCLRPFLAMIVIIYVPNCHVRPENLPSKRTAFFSLHSIPIHSLTLLFLFFCFNFIDECNIIYTKYIAYVHLKIYI